MSDIPRILIVDDDVRVARLVSRYLSKHGFQVTDALDAQTMWRVFDKFRPDLVILDLQLPDDHGLMLAKKLREKSNVGIVILTASLDETDKIVGLELGADDFVTKPFSERELLARVRSVLRRVSGQSEPSGDADKSVVHFAGWRIDVVAHELLAPSGVVVDLTSHEFHLLRVLVESANRVLTRDYIAATVSGRDWLPNDRSIDVLVSKLRKKLRDHDPENPNLIRTIRGAGYKLAARVDTGR